MSLVAVVDVGDRAAHVGRPAAGVDGDPVGGLRQPQGQLLVAVGHLHDVADRRRADEGERLAGGLGGELEAGGRRAGDAPVDPAETAPRPTDSWNSGAATVARSTPSGRVAPIENSRNSWWASITACAAGSTSASTKGTVRSGQPVERDPRLGVADRDAVLVDEHLDVVELVGEAGAELDEPAGDDDHAVLAVVATGVGGGQHQRRPRHPVALAAAR